MRCCRSTWLGPLGASMLVVGIVEGVAEAIAMIVKVFSGFWSDKLRHRKPIVVLGYGLAAVSKLAFPLAPTLEWVIAARFVDRIGKGHPRRAARRADRRPDASRDPRRRFRPAPGARHRRRDQRPAARGRGDWHTSPAISARRSGSPLIPAALCVAVLVLGVDEHDDGRRCHRCVEARVVARCVAAAAAILGRHGHRRRADAGPLLRGVPDPAGDRASAWGKPVHRG